MYVCIAGGHTDNDVGVETKTLQTTNTAAITRFLTRVLTLIVCN